MFKIFCNKVFDEYQCTVSIGQSMKEFNGNTVLIQGVECLHGAPVTASDLRSGAALVMAGIAAEGKTKVYGYEYIARGYEDICGTMGRLGAKIVYVEENKQHGE